MISLLLGFYSAHIKGFITPVFSLIVVVKIPMERTAALLKWDVAGEVLVPGVFVEDDIDKTDGCAQAAALAEKF